jgi:hypothetical protein
VFKIRLLKVATPLTAATEVVLPLAKEPGPLATVTVTVEVFDVTTLLAESWIAIFSAVPKACPAVPVVAAWVIASLLAGEVLTTTLPEVVPVSEPSATLNVYVPAAFSTRLLKVATPLAAVADVVLPVAKGPGPVATVTVTVDVFDVTMFPKVSCTATVSAVLKACPAEPVVGACVMASFVAAAGLTVTMPVVAAVSAPSLTVRV